MPKEKLKSCPSCMLTKEVYEKLKAKRNPATYKLKFPPYTAFIPKIYKSRFLNNWVIECQNCGMQIIFNKDKEICIKLWNGLI